MGALAKDDVRSRSRLVVNYKAEACPLLLLFVAILLRLTTIVYIVFRSMRW